MRKGDLKPGMTVKNVTSKSTGVVRGEKKNPRKLMTADKHYVRVMILLPPWFKRATRPAVWMVSHLEPA